MAEPITLARPYAKAVFQVAAQSNDLAGWSKMLRQVALVCSDERVQSLLASLFAAERCIARGGSERRSPGPPP